MSRPAPQFDISPIATLLKMAEQFSPVKSESVPLHFAAGRALAEPLAADRDHPACDVSAVDGFALNWSEESSLEQPIVGESRIGQIAPTAEGGAIRIVTGAPIPPGVNIVVRREEVQEKLNRIVLDKNRIPKSGQDIRRTGDNARSGETIVESGSIITPTVISALATFGISRPLVRKKLRVSLIVSGDELLGVDGDPKPWQLRDSHGWAVPAMLGSVPWIDFQSVQRVKDDLDAITKMAGEAIGQCDTVILTGGVSMGDRDFIPTALQRIGAKIQFHGLPIRPGKPMLGAIGPSGQAIFGLPGNPLSVLVTARRFASIVLRKLAGLNVIDPPPTRVIPANAEKVDAKFWLFRPVVLREDGKAELLPVRSSGDLITAARSDGFVQIAAGLADRTLLPFYSWSF
jgi:molybdopterin molybdotransferase